MVSTPSTPINPEVSSDQSGQTEAGPSNVVQNTPTGSQQHLDAPADSNQDQNDPGEPQEFADLAAARAWLTQKRDEEELKRIIQMRLRYEAGEVDAIKEPAPAQSLPAAQPPSALGRLPSPKAPHEYAKKGRRDFNLWKQDCEKYFTQSPSLFPTESTKVNFGLQYVSEILRTTWAIETRHKKAQNADWEETWDFLKEKMLSALGTESERRQKAFNSLKSCRQLSSQSPSELLDYMRNLWEELEIIEEGRMVLDYLSALNSNITDKLYLLPVERRNTVSLIEEQASFIHRSTKVQKKNKKTSGVTTGKHKTTDAETEGDRQTPKKAKRGEKDQEKPKGANRALSGKGSTNRKIVCWHCRKPGHIKPKCPDKDKPPVPDPDLNQSGKGKGKRD